jgi:Spy/CpxP family protein refolding chaperone
MKRIVLALCITAAASFAFAQDPHAMKMRVMVPNPDEIAATLGLSVDQKVQFDSIHQQLEANVGPLFQQLESAHHQLESLASASNPDPTAVGTQFLAARAIEQQVKAAHEAAHQKLVAILTPDQKTKFEALHHDMAHNKMEMHMRHPEGGSRD